MTIPIVGKCFATVEEFIAYLEAIQFDAWRPRYVVMHHTGAPDLKTWNGWQTRPKPVTDEQWMRNLQKYYEGLGWQRAPQFFFTPKNFCVLSLPTVRGTHAVSFNANSWGVECVGDFDREQFDDPVRGRYVDGLAALHLAAGLQLAPYERGVRGLHFHRDDPLTKKTCPGLKVNKPALLELIRARMGELTDGDHPDEQIIKAAPQKKVGTVKVPAGDTLNVRAAASGKAPLVATLPPGAEVTITGSATNVETPWLSIDIPGDADGWVAARFVKVN